MKQTRPKPDPEGEGNIVPLPAPNRLGRIPMPENAPPQTQRQRFRVVPFENTGGSKAWRVQGMKRDGSYVRQNFSDYAMAQARQIELEAEYLQRRPEDATIRATKLSDTQLRIAESAFLRLAKDDEMLLAVDHWLKHGRNQPAAVEAPRLDDAVQQFKDWLAATPELRPQTKAGLRIRVTTFANSVGNHRVNEITPEILDTYLQNRKVSPLTRNNDKRALSRFFKWCIDRKRRWMTSNPAREVTVTLPEKAPPSILSVEQCRKLLRAAMQHKDGRLAPYVSIGLFAGLRPFELTRLNWDQINLADGEIRLDGTQTKTRVSRVVAICPTLKAWLLAHKGKPVYPPNWLKDFRAVRALAGITAWPSDVARHTAVSHYFRLTGSYGRTAEAFGNSESIIKKHYQGRVSSADTNEFYALTPKGVSK